MYTVFLTCAVIGSTVMIFQFVITLIGAGSDAFDVDGGGDVDMDTDFDVDGDIDADAGHGDGHVDSSWLFAVISVRTVVAALAFFGLTGLSVRSSTMSSPLQLLAAVAAGLAAMLAVYWMMRCLKSMKAEGTPKVGRAVGRFGTVYTTIPAEESGSGKIQINLQSRTMEYLAMTSGHALAPGAKVVVTDVITSNTVAVEPALESDAEPDMEPERNHHV